MKKNIFLAGLIAVAALSSCDNDDSYSAAPFEKGSKVFFSNSLPSVINPSSLESSYAITLNRTDVGESLDVALNVTNSGENFLVPTTASFAADSKEAQITISYDIDKVGFDVFDTITIAVDPALASLYSVAEYTFVIGIPAPWKSLGKGLIVDDYVTTFFGVENVSWEVEIQENELYPGYFRLVNPYCENYPYNDPGDWDTTKDFYLEIHAEDPAKVYIPTQVSNTAWSNYGYFIFSSMAGYYLAKGDVDNAEGYYGKFENGIISFPPEALLFGMTAYNDGGLYTSNGNGAFKVVMPGIVLADYSAEVKYSGKLYDADDNLYIVASATLGADVEEIRLAVCAAGEEEAIAEALANGTLESAVSLSESGSVNLPFDADAVSGKYSIVGVTFGGGEAQELVSATFKYTSLNGEPVETWTAYFVGTATYNCLWEEPKTDPEVVLSASDNDPTQERCKVAPWINNAEGMIFSWPEEGDVVVAPNQEIGLDYQGAEIMVADMAAECLLVPGTSWAQVVTSNFAKYLTGDENKPSAFESNLFSFNVIYYTEGGSVLGWGFDTYKLTANASAPGARNLFAPAEKQTPHLQFIEHPLILKNCVRRDAVRAF